MVSVIIPTYNGGNVLFRAIESILIQNYQDFEIIIVDDGSTDGTQELFKKGLQDERIHYFYLEKNRGVHVARNFGLDKSKGDFIVFLDSDDELYKNALDVALHSFDLHHDVGVFFAPFSVNGTKELSGFNMKKEGYVNYQDYLCERNMHIKKGQFFMIRKRYMGDIRWAMQNLDFIFFRRLARNTKMYFYPLPLGIYNIVNNAETLHVRRPNKELSKKRAIAMDLFIKEFRTDLEKYCPYMLGTYAYGAAVGLLLAGMKKKSRSLFFISFRYGYKRVFDLFF
ncbi:MAG: hypothetical protein COV59_03730, partial [Candidatus Magasanikbacteria bacterium CG11_big_fil_rev_8_21_14_0_20_39_34]